MVLVLRKVVGFATGFRPLTGMVLAVNLIQTPYVEFLPPYGDGTSFGLKTYGSNGFSPPYGDGTRKAEEAVDRY